MHVDDGILTGNGVVFKKAMDNMLGTLRIKHPQKNDFVYLSRRICRQGDGAIHVTFDVSHLSQVTVTADRNNKPDDPVTEEERTSLRSITGELGWPAREGYPEFCYGASELQQRVPEVTVGTIL